MSAVRFACEKGEFDGTMTLLLNEVRIEPITSFGSTFIREDQLAAALGYQLLSHFQAAVRDARIYSGGSRRMEVLTDNGYLPMTVYSLNGAHQFALCLQARGNSERSRLARELIDMLRMLESPKRGPRS